MAVLPNNATGPMLLGAVMYGTIGERSNLNPFEFECAIVSKGANLRLQCRQYSEALRHTFTRYIDIAIPRSDEIACESGPIYKRDLFTGKERLSPALEFWKKKGLKFASKRERQFGIWEQEKKTFVRLRLNKKAWDEKMMEWRGNCYNNMDEYQKRSMNEFDEYGGKIEILIVVPGPPMTYPRLEEWVDMCNPEQRIEQRETLGEMALLRREWRRDPEHCTRQIKKEMKLCLMSANALQERVSMWLALMKRSQHLPYFAGTHFF